MHKNIFYMILQLSLFTLMLVPISCAKETQEPAQQAIGYRDFKSIHDFETCWDSLLMISDSALREQQLNNLWDSLKTNQQIPFCMNDTALFLYRGSSAPTWVGDFNGWGSETDAWVGQKIGETKYWRLKKSFPPDARMDYKIVVGTSWILDPSNPHIQYSGFGPNSSLQMPEWQFPEETVLSPNIVKGTLSGNMQTQSSPGRLNYAVNYKVYTPYNYATVSNCPVIYVTDGHEYADQNLGAMVTVLDNLIFKGVIEPVIAVFIDPRDPNNGNNRRMSEYRANPKFAAFVAEELVPEIDNNFKTNPSPEKRAILGTSLGGWNSAFFGLTQNSSFQLIGIHSPAFDNKTLSDFQNSAMLPLKIYMSTGTIFDTQEKARQMRDILTEKNYPLLYKEVNEGHSWGNWRALIDEPLVYFFGTGK